MPMLNLNLSLSSLIIFTKRAGGNKLKRSTADETRIVTQLQLKVYVRLLAEILQAGMVDLNFLPLIIMHRFCNLLAPSFSPPQILVSVY